MADAVKVDWIYPPNWDGNPPEDTRHGWRKVTVQLSGISDGTGETDVTKVDISELRCSNGAVPTRTVVEEIQYVNEGFTSILLEWDRAANAHIATIPGGSDKMCFRKMGGKVDPGEAGDRTGDILLTTAGATSGDSYNIILTMRLKES